MSIFVSIASYRDTELVKTIRSIYDNADHPEELVFGVLSQDHRGKHPNLSFLPNVRYETMHSKDARGAGYARKRVMALYDDEDYFLQTDSHMRFAKGWDTKLLNMLAAAQAEAMTGKVILSQFPAPYEVHSDGKDFYIKGDKDFWDDVSWTSVVNTFYGAWAGHRNVMEDKTKPHESHTILAGLIFAPGYFVHEIPYDERISFMGEELCIAIRAYTRRWKIYAPNEMVCWHFYKRKEHPKVWSQTDDATRAWNWKDIEKESFKVQKNVLLEVEQGIYGVGDHDLYKEYQSMIGWNFQNFYEVGLQEKIDMGLLYEELDFRSTKKSGYCMNARHKECLNSLCDCDCHEGAKK